MVLKRLRGTTADDILDARAARPDQPLLVRGFEGRDLILGGSFDDSVRGDDGDDTLNGDFGADTVRGGRGDDVLFGFGDGARDELLGRHGDDRIVIGGSINTGPLGFGRDLVRGGDGFDTLVVRIDNNFGRRSTARFEAEIAELEAWIASDPGPQATLRLKALGVRVKSIEAVEVVREPPVVEKRDIEAGRGGIWIQGAEFGSNAGYDVAALGDVNGDGLADLLIGAPGLSRRFLDPSTGEAYVVFGRRDTRPIDLAEVALGIGGYKLSAGVSRDRVGAAVAGIGDLNGDGIPDLLIGAPGDDRFPNPPVAAYVVYGKADGTAVDLADLDPTEGYRLFGRGNSDDSSTLLGVGWSVKALGDVNGDGLPDFAITDWSSIGGNVTVVFGGAADDDIELFAIPAAGRGFLINLEFPPAGQPSIAAVGDVNGDGLADLLIGVGAVPRDASDRAGAGAAYLVFGKADAAAVDLAEVARGIGGVKIIGEPRPSGFGGISAVGGAGDVNGDGIPDLIIGASFAGEAFVVFGRREFDGPIDLVDVAAGNGGFLLTRGFSIFGNINVGAAGDVNGDGFDDLLVGVGDGAVIVFGKPDGRPVQIGLGTNGEGFEGVGILDEFSPNRVTGGFAAAGDVNGDGFDDLVFGAPFQDRDGGVFLDDVSGGAYIVFGRADWAI